MIEIKITIDVALNLLLERMKLELKLRQRDGMISKGLRLENLSYKQLYPIIETSISDTIFLLPVELIIQETNLIHIITGTVRALSRILHREEFLLFSNRKAQKLIVPIYEYFNRVLQEKNFINN